MKLNCCVIDDFPSGLTGIETLSLSVLSGFISTAKTFRTPSVSDIVPELTTAVVWVDEIVFHAVNTAGESGRLAVFTVNDISSSFHVPAGMTFTFHISLNV